MKRIFLICCLSATLLGCGNLSPRIDPELNQRIDNQNGRIDEIESNQNSIKNELQMQGNILDRVQNGLLNQQNNNSGIQILSGSGGLFIGLIGIISIFVVLIHYRQRATNAEKAADILAENIVDRDDPDLNENVFKAAMFTDAEEIVHDLVKKYQKIQSQS